MAGYKKHNVTKTQYYGSDVDSTGKAIAPPIAQNGKPETGINPGEIALNNASTDPCAFILDTEGKVVKIGGGTDIDLLDKRYLLKSTYEDVFLKENLGTDENPNWVLRVKYNVLFDYDFAIFGSKSFQAPSIVNAIPLGDGLSIVDGKLTVTSTGGIDTEAMWIALAGSTNEQINKSHLTDALSGYATQTWVQNQGYLTQHQSLAGYATEAWVNTQIADNAYSLPTASSTVLGGVKIGQNISITNGVISTHAPYELTKDKILSVLRDANGIIELDASLVLTGDFAIYSTTQLNVPSIMDGLVLDPDTLAIVNGALTVIGGTGGGLDETELANYLNEHNYYHSGNSNKSDVDWTGAIVKANTGFRSDSYKTLDGSLNMIQILNNNVYLGNRIQPITIASNNSNLEHDKNGAFYTVWDASNANLSGVDWATYSLRSYHHIEVNSGIDTKLIFNNTDGEKYTVISFRENGSQYASITADGRSNGTITLSGLPVRVSRLNFDTASIDESGNFGIGMATSGGNARGQFYHSGTYLGTRLGGIGCYTENGVLGQLYMGWTDTPWNQNFNFHVNSTEIKYKTNTVYHAGNSNNLSTNWTANVLTAKIVDIKDSIASEVYARYFIGGTARAATGWASSLGSYLYNYSSNKYLNITDSGSAIFAGNTLLHSGNYKDYVPVRVGDGSIYVYPQYNNEINFGCINASNVVYFGYRAVDSKPIPAIFVFGGSNGSADLLVNRISLGQNDFWSTLKLSIHGNYPLGFYYSGGTANKRKYYFSLGASSFAFSSLNDGNSWVRTLYEIDHDGRFNLYGNGVLRFGNSSGYIHNTNNNQVFAAPSNNCVICGGQQIQKLFLETTGGYAQTIEGLDTTFSGVVKRVNYASDYFPAYISENTAITGTDPDHRWTIYHSKSNVRRGLSFWSYDANGTVFNEVMTLSSYGGNQLYVNGTIVISGDFTIYKSFSDRNLKTNLKEFDAHSLLSKFGKVVEFDYTNEALMLNPNLPSHDFNFIAQNVQKAMPQLVGEECGYLTLNLYKRQFISLLAACEVQTISQLKILNDWKTKEEKEIDRLKKENRNLRKRVSALEELVNDKTII